MMERAEKMMDEANQYRKSADDVLLGLANSRFSVDHERVGIEHRPPLGIEQK